MSLPSGCGVCGQQDGVLRCSGCKVMPYCGVDHQKAHRQEHKSACSAIRRSRVAMEKAEKDLRERSATVFTNDIGQFWDLVETRPYMLARAALTDNLNRVHNVEAVQAQLDHLMENLRLCRSDNMGSRHVIPSLMIRLQKEQECYDFLKWWATTGQDDNYDWGDTTKPYLDIKNANPLEPVDIFCDNLIDLPFLTSLTLLKIKVLYLFYLPLIESGRAAAFEGAEQSMRFKDSSIAHNPHIVNCANRFSEIEKLRAQICTLYKAVHSMNPHFWPALLNPAEHVRAHPMTFSPGSAEQMQVALNLTYDSWFENLEATAAIRLAMADDL
ncbi:Zinc finger MYND-type [Penicillium paradoxum]|uniref:Zinc finger MYND-type n=1 Tax=Penicillium paradoxum TaxID=176176 RepID=UPI0025484291|nr:Zinc finger MYND-type [Penicillium paradoxum]KAJ5780738.1 Zinc finger MYND-type [Penicillium paradoxum]